MRQAPWHEHDHTLYRQLQKRGEMLGSQNYFPLIVEFTKSSDEDDPTTPLAQHLIGFLKVLARLRLRYNGPIAMVMYPPIPRDWEDTESYEFILQQHEQNCKIAVFLGELTGILVHCFALFETQVPNNKGWYYRKKSWNKEALIGQTGKFTKEFFTRQKEELTLLLRSLCNARIKEFST